MSRCEERRGSGCKNDDDDNLLAAGDEYTQRPTILVGYAFGPKKMSTMSVIMKEASMAVSTVATQFPCHFYQSSRHLGTTHDNHHHDEKDYIRVFGNNDHAANVEDQEHNDEHDDAGLCDAQFCQGDCDDVRKRYHVCANQSSSSSSSSFCSSASCASLTMDKSETKGCHCCDLSFSETASKDNVILLQNVDDAMASKDRPICIFPSSFFVSSASSETLFQSQKKMKMSVEEASFVTVTTASTMTASARPPFSYHHTPPLLPPPPAQLDLLDPSITHGQTLHSLSRHSFHPIKVSFVPLDLDSCLEEQHGGKFDVILHKMTEDILCISQLEYHGKLDSVVPLHESESESESKIQALQRIQRLNDYKLKYPSCCLIDHPTNVQKLMSRGDIASTLETCLRGVETKSGIQVKTPRYRIISDFNSSSSLTVAKDIDDSKLEYPLLIKPLTAAGTKQSHKMGVLLGRYGLTEIQGKAPFLLQEYANHDGILFKVYVLGNRVWVFQRPSLPNLPRGEAFPEYVGTNGCENEKEVSIPSRRGLVEFDSQRPYPTLDDFGISPSEAVVGSEQVPRYEEVVTVDEIRPVADSIRKAFGLDLFGFDVLVTEVNNHPLRKEILVVDVNYFPSYKEVTNFSQLLAQYLAQCGIEGRLRSYDSVR